MHLLTPVHATFPAHLMLLNLVKITNHEASHYVPVSSFALTGPSILLRTFVKHSLPLQDKRQYKGQVILNL